MKNIFDNIHHFFIPRRTNNFKAKLLHHDFLTVYLVFALALTIGFNHFKQISGDVLGFATDITIPKLYELTNEERTKAGLSPLTYNEKLAVAAEKKAQDMFAKDYWSHYGPSGETPWDFILGSGYQYEFAGENLAKNFLFTDGVVNAWMDSPTHRENILRSEYSDVGFAMVNGVLNGEETTLVVQMFAKPLYEQAPVEAQNAPIDTEPLIAAEKPKVPEQTQPVVLSRETSSPSGFFPAYFNLNILFFAIMITALLMDFYFAAKRFRPKFSAFRESATTVIHVFLFFSFF